MTDQQQIAAPANASEAQTQLNTLTADRSWADRYMNGDAAARAQFEQLTGMAVDHGSADDVVDAVMAGKPAPLGNSEQRQMADVVDQFRSVGIADGVTKEFLSGHQYTPTEYQAVANLKRELMGDREFVAKYLAGDVKANQRMTTINAVLVNGARMEESK
jgi:hypothetical protein